MYLSPAAGKRNWTKPWLKSVPTSPPCKGTLRTQVTLTGSIKRSRPRRASWMSCFANAGVVEPVPTAAVTTEHYDKTFGINARGVYFTVQKALPLMKDGGSIIVNGSGAWQKGIPIYSTYSATKAALRSFVRTWTAEFAAKGIRTNMVSPGATDTPILEGQFGANVDAMKDQFKAMTPMGRIGRPEEIASAVLFLASDESSYITGIDLPVDGGIVAV